MKTPFLIYCFAVDQAFSCSQRTGLTNSLRKLFLIFMIFNDGIIL